jgi:hypothetical protein
LADRRDVLVARFREVMLQSPNGNPHPVCQTQLKEDSIQVPLDGPFREVQFAGDFLVQFVFGNESHNLLFPETQLPIERFVLPEPGETAGGTNSISAS